MFDPKSELDEALGSMEQVPEDHVSRGRWLCREHREFRSADIEQHVVTIVRHPSNGRYMVFVSTFSHVWDKEDADGTVVASFPIYDPSLFAWCASRDDAYDMQRRICSAWGAVAEQKLEGWGQPSSFWAAASTEQF